MLAAVNFPFYKRKTVRPSIQQSRQAISYISMVISLPNSSTETIIVRLNTSDYIICFEMLIFIDYHGLQCCNGSNLLPTVVYHFRRPLRSQQHFLFPISRADIGLFEWFHIPAGSER